MKIFVCASKHAYHRLNEIIETLKKQGHEITFPNSFNEPFKEEDMKKLGEEAHIKWKSEQLKLQGDKIKENDAILVANFMKNGIENYIGGATFLEIFKAWELGKKIFLLNPIPDNILKDELVGMNPIILKGNLDLI